MPPSRPEISKKLVLLSAPLPATKRTLLPCLSSVMAKQPGSRKLLMSSKYVRLQQQMSEQQQRRRQQKSQQQDALVGAFPQETSASQRAWGHRSDAACVFYTPVYLCSQVEH